MNVGKVGYGTFDRDDGIVGRVFVIIRVGGYRVTQRLIRYRCSCTCSMEG